MQPTDPQAFKALLQGVHDFYGKELSEFAIGVWWEAMRPYDFAAVKDALNRHAVNPDNGQFLPKPADVVKLIGGGTQDGALVAWAKVDRAVRAVGAYKSVVFDDAIIHRVIEDMGGWVQICGLKEDEWPFRAKEFENRYRGYRIKGQIGAYPHQLIGLAEGHNTGRYAVAPPVMVGDSGRCQVVHRGGSDLPAVSFKPLPVHEALGAML